MSATPNLIAKIEGLPRYPVTDRFNCTEDCVPLKFVLALLATPEPEGRTVRIPTSADEAAMMVGVGLSWLENHAPDRLTEAFRKPEPEESLNDIINGYDIRARKPGGVAPLLRSTSLATSEKPFSEGSGRLSAIIERDRADVAEALTAVRNVLGGYDWLAHSRGPYAYDDDRWKEEFGRAWDAVHEALKPLDRIAGDLTDCPKTTAEARIARQIPREPAPQQAFTALATQGPEVRMIEAPAKCSGCHVRFAAPSTAGTTTSDLCPFCGGRLVTEAAAAPVVSGEEPPPDHDDFIATRNAGLPAIRAQIEARRRVSGETDPTPLAVARSDDAFDDATPLQLALMLRHVPGEWLYKPHNDEAYTIRVLLNAAARALSGEQHTPANEVTNG
jgi:hypothetical protein